MFMKESKTAAVCQIIQNEQIKSVYQPIISLTDGKVLGYEALARITCSEPDVFIEEMFVLAEQCGKLWELEYLCRKKAMAEIGKDLASQKLFLNVDPYVMYDPRFREGMARKYLKEYGISAANLVFEITERTNIQNEHMSLFQELVSHYQKENYQIAIDDFGKACAGLQRVIDLHPQFVKIDMDLIRDIHKSPEKSRALRRTVKFCKPLGIQLIAEGIEEREELRELIRLGILYGQGYLIAKPQEVPQPIAPEILQLIQWERRIAAKGAAAPVFQVQRDSFTRLPRSGG